jgi:hypothetical protein
MESKVKLRQIIRPLLISYAIGVAAVAILAWFAETQGEKFLVVDAEGMQTSISFGEFITLALNVVIIAFVVTALSLVVSRIQRTIIIVASVLTMLALTFALGPGTSVLWLALIVGNIGLYRGRSRLYVASLGIALFVMQIFNAWTRTGDVETFSWLVAIDIAFAAPILFVIFKYLPKQNLNAIAK